MSHIGGAYVAPWGPLGPLGTPMGRPWAPMGAPWAPMGPHGPHGAPWAPWDAQWVPSPPVVVRRNFEKFTKISISPSLGFKMGQKG